MGRDRGGLGKGRSVHEQPGAKVEWIAPKKEGFQLSKREFERGPKKVKEVKKGIAP